MDFLKAFAYFIAVACGIIQGLAWTCLFLYAPYWAYVAFDVYEYPTLIIEAVLRIAGCVLFGLAFRKFTFDDVLEFLER
ncbi:hypothetical protein SAMN04487996_10435 [Dyadobacter soli]|uniref:Uncharacterized protein n=1 Tax=Dyadobacter soli TaxID=659014 RepID=A0A1G7B0P4_9BACT|nr:hypothetical protein [Dyadobacter soli]SDE20522.1 hypothetical protein SAMN04487996_10435 [Dyadobacter soli]